MLFWILLFLILVVLFGWSLTAAGIAIVKILLFIAAVVVLLRVIRGDRHPL